MKIYYKIFKILNRLSMTFLHLYHKTGPELDPFGIDAPLSEPLPVDRNEQVAQILEPVWSELQAVNFLLDNNQTTSEQRKEFMNDLDLLHDGLLEAVEDIE